MPAPLHQPWSHPALCVGEALIDLIGQPPGPIAAIEAFFPRVGGAPTNVSTGIVRLGGRARFLGAVSGDEMGDWQLSTLEAAGVDVRPARRIPNAPSRIALITGAVDDRRFTFYGDPPADSLLEPSMIEPDAVVNAPAIYIGSLGLSREPIRSAILTLLDMAATSDTPIVFDPNPRRDTWPEPAVARAAVTPVLQQARAVKIGVADLEVLGMSIEDVVASARADSVVVLTDGQRGCWYWYGEKRGAPIPALRVDEVDPTGAGDAFTAALIVRFVESDGVIGDDDLRFASAAGALATTAYGAMTALPNRAQVVRLMSSGIAPEHG
jgi:fructokinase